VVSEEKYHQLKVIKMNLKYFTTNEGEGWIFAKNNRDIKATLEK
jgi:hypothetical protein